MTSTSYHSKRNHKREYVLRRLAGTRKALPRDAPDLFALANDGSLAAALPSDGLSLLGGVALAGGTGAPQQAPQARRRRKARVKLEAEASQYHLPPLGSAEGLAYTLKTQEHLRKEARAKNFAAGLSPRDLLPQLRVLSPAQYGKKFEGWWIRRQGWTEVSSREDRGDALTGDGSYVEIKLTMAEGQRAKFSNIRLHQAVAGYHCFMALSDNRLAHFYLTHGEMEAEVKEHGVASNGTKASNADQRVNGWSIQVPWDGKRGREWQAKYLVGFVE